MLLCRPRLLFQRRPSPLGTRLRDASLNGSTKLPLSADLDPNYSILTLEKVPPEIILLILKSLSNIQDLKSFVHAVPFAHRCYVAERQSVLTEVLMRELSPQILLTLAACLKAPNVTEMETSDSTYTEFLDKYPIFTAQFTRDAQVVLTTDIIQATRLHEVVNACIRDFITFCSRECPILETNDPVPQLTPTEKHRLLWAFYRFELSLRLFSDNNSRTKRHDSTSGYKYRWKCIDEIQSFRSSALPWEAEEGGCVLEYMTSEYDAILSDINQKRMASDRNWRSHRARRSKASPPSAPAPYSQEQSLALTTLGLDFFRRAAASCAVDKRNETITNILATSFADKYDSIIRGINEDSFRSVLPPPDGLFEPWPEEGHFVDFTGDKIGKPNAAWVGAHGYRMTYGFLDPSFAGLRKWGYVFWDKERLGRMGAKLLAVHSSKRERLRSNE